MPPYCYPIAIITHRFFITGSLSHLSFYKLFTYLPIFPEAIIPKNPINGPFAGGHALLQNKIAGESHFKEERGIKILHIRGEPYEMGYQHGYLLAGRIAFMINRTPLATAAYVAKQTG